MTLSDPDHVVGIEEADNSEFDLVMVEHPSATVSPAGNGESLETDNLPKHYIKLHT